MNANFFESFDKDTLTSNIWTKYEAGMEKTPIIHSGYLKKHSKEGDAELSVRFFQLHKDHLLYRKSEHSESVSSVMPIKFARLVLPNQDGTDVTPANMIKDRFPLKLCLKNKYSLLYAQNEQEYQAWIEAFTQAATRTDFHSRFTVSKIIGSGAFANVYESTEKRSQKKFAVKGFNKHYLEQQTRGKESLWNEICILKQMNHRNLLKLYEVHETKNSMYLVFDIYEGGELSKLLEDKPGVKEDDCRNIVIGLLRGLDHMASKDMVHRDLKPNNIMLRKNTNIQPDDVVIVDFGLSSSIHEKNMIYKRCGTPGYIAPEIIGAKNVEQSFTVTTKCDVFGVGSILFYMMVGRNPFEKLDYSVDQIIKKNLEGKVDYPTAQMSKYSAETIKLVKTMLTVDPIVRPSAKNLLICKPLGDKAADYNCDDCDLDECFSRSGQMPASLIKSIPSIQKKAGMAGFRDNQSIGVNSRGMVEQHPLDSPLAVSPRKGQFSSLYKQSLMRGKAPSTNSNQQEFLNSIVNSAKISGRTAIASINSSSNGNKSDKDSKSSLEVDSPKMRNSCFVSAPSKSNSVAQGNRASQMIQPGLSPFAKADHNARAKDI